MLWHHHLRKIFLISIASVITSSCIEPYSAPALTVDYNYLVVEGVLINGDSTAIKLSRTSTLEPEVKPTMETDAFVQMQEEDGTNYTMKNIGNGIYNLPPLQLNKDHHYRLYIRTANGKEYVSDYVALKQSPAIDEVAWQEQDDGIHISLTTHSENHEPGYYLWSYEETWKYSSLYYSVYSYIDGIIEARPVADELYYCFKTVPGTDIRIFSTNSLSQDIVSNFQFLTIPSESRRLEYQYSLLIKQFSLTKEAYEYWYALLRNNETVGSLSDPLPSQDVGNLHCVTNEQEPVLGYFSASSVSVKRIFIDRQQLTGPDQYEPSIYEDLNCVSEVVSLEDLGSKMTGKLIIDKKFDINEPFELIGYIVAPQECIDCRYKGGKIAKPDYWP